MAMSSPAPLRPQVLPKEDEQPRSAPSRSWQESFGLWKQVFLAELLNLLERRRYDLK
jgi:hypothetical protein